MKDKIYDEYYNKIYYWTLKKMKNREDAQDLLNDIFVEIFTYINKLVDNNKMMKIGRGFSLIVNGKRMTMNNKEDKYGK